MKFDSLNGFKEYIVSLSDKSQDISTIWVCGGPGCLANGSGQLFEAFEKAISKNGPVSDDNSFLQKLKVKLFSEGPEEVISIKTGLSGCMGPCENGPIVYIEPNGFYYQKVKPADVDIILKSLHEGKVCESLAPRYVSGKNYTEPTSDNIPFLSKQYKLVLGHMNNMSPLELDDYLKHGGYTALIRVLETMSPEEVCQSVVDSGLRGRGGGGFPTGGKWNSCRKSESSKRYVLVNGDEGDPGAFMDRCLMEGDPYSIIEGLTIGAYAVGSDEGIVYVRHEYPLAVLRLNNAVNKLTEAGLLGNNILGSGFNFNVEICQGGGAFVCGESSALMTSVEGRPGVPRVKYIRSTEKGLWNLPTVLNNVETWANIPIIVNNGAEWFKKIGTENNSGTKVFALVGKVKNTGLVEVPMGITLRDIIFGIGGGVTGDHPFKAVQTGGPSGGCLPSIMLDTPVDFDSLTSAGSMMGSGGMIVMDDRTCMVDVARYFIDFLAEESCGKCVPCREGLKKMQILLHDLTSGKGREGDTKALEELANEISDTSLCALGQSSANPVLSTIKYFPEEYAEHEKEHFCRAGICPNMFNIIIEAEKCQSCGLCAKKCPVSAINKTENEKYLIDQDICIRCSICIDTCPFASIKVVKEVPLNGTDHH